MGCLCCKLKEEEEEIHSQLIPHFKCFVCNTTFTSNIEYNKHIPQCNIGNIKHK